MNDSKQEKKRMKIKSEHYLTWGALAGGFSPFSVPPSHGKEAEELGCDGHSRYTFYTLIKVRWINRQYYLVFAISALVFGWGAQYLPKARGWGQMQGTKAKCQGRYWKHQVMLYLLCDSHCWTERNTLRYQKRNTANDIFFSFCMFALF